MKIVVIGSGSKGNCIFIQSNNAKILIDCGISIRRVKQELANQDLTLDNLDAIFITHEHRDHIGHLGMFLKKTDATLYINQQSFNNSCDYYEENLKYDQLRFINKHTKYHVKDIVVVPIQMSHDAINCYGFLIKCHNATYAHITDTGIIYDEYFSLIGKCNTVYIESNHDEYLLKVSERPEYLIQRILSNTGHLSNVTCSYYLTKIVSPLTKNVILAHLSEECNTPDMAKEEVKKQFPTLPFNLLLAKQYEALKAIDIDEE